MPRPRRVRRVFFEPRIDYFKPAGVMLSLLQENIITRDELEVIRLIDYEKTEQEKAGKKMRISQPTLSRLLSSARKKTADALINGKAIRIQGGVFEMVRPRFGMRRAIGGVGGRGRMRGFAAGPTGLCICPKCRYKEPHTVGVPCYNKKCPKCGTKMTRG